MDSIIECTITAGAVILVPAVWYREVHCRYNPETEQANVALDFWFDANQVFTMMQKRHDKAWSWTGSIGGKLAMNTLKTMSPLPTRAARDLVFGDSGQ
jgi:hypothetical protein